MSVSLKKILGCAVAVSTGAMGSALVHADVLHITNDTFIDSGSYGSPSPDPTMTGEDNHGDPQPTSGTDPYSYGADGKVKAVTSNYSSGYPFVTATHTLFTLPSSFWQEIGAGPVSSVVVSYYVLNDSLKPQDNHPNLELHPLLSGFTTGNGQQSTATSTSPSPSTDGGATWLTTDGNVSDTWQTPGGDFDNTAGDYVTADISAGLPVKGSAFTWNITSLINNPTTRQEIQDNGLLIKVQNESDLPVYNGIPSSASSNAENDFVSLYSANEQAAGTNTGGTSGFDPAGAYLPTVSVTVPEPVTLSIFAVAGLLTFGRRRSTVGGR